MSDQQSARPQRGDLLLTAPEIDRHLADIAAGGLDLTTFTVVSAWGRKEP